MAAAHGDTINLTLHVWRQKDAKDPGRMATYRVDAVSTHASFLEMLDILNEQLIGKGEEPIAFDSDCREGICGTCGVMINGRPHGGQVGTTTCQLHMRQFRDGDEIYVEPWRAAAFPVIKDLCVDRTSMDRIIAAGGFVTLNCGSAPEANSIPVPKDKAEEAFEAAACIQCGACVAACPNGSAMLFTAAKLAHLHLLPQGQPERMRRTRSMVDAMDAAGFGNCTNHYECEAACPKEIDRSTMSLMYRDYGRASLAWKPHEGGDQGAG
jgi:succinate dehydrogenase / fumarate reductase, iron-sulfur subunit